MNGGMFSQQRPRGCFTERVCGAQHLAVQPRSGKQNEALLAYVFLPHPNTEPE